MSRTVRRFLAPLLALALLAAAPGTAGRQKRSGNQLLVDGQYEEALTAYREGLAKAPEDPELHINAGAALYRLTRSREAAEEFRRGQALASDPAVRRAALYNEGTALLEAGDAAGAAARLRQVLLEDPEDDSARRNLEIALARQENQPQNEEKKSGGAQQGKGEKGESKPKPESGDRPEDKPPDGNSGEGGDQPPVEKQPSSSPGAGDRRPQPAGEHEQPPAPAPEQGARPLTKQEAERLLAAIGQGEKADLRAALAEMSAKPRRQGNPERDW